MASHACEAIIRHVLGFVFYPNNNESFTLIKVKRMFSKTFFVAPTDGLGWLPKRIDFFGKLPF